MEWFTSLFTSPSIAHTLLIYCATIAIGMALGKIRFKGIALGATFVLFVGLAIGHFGVQIDPLIVDFLKNFGLILFVFAVGLQVGPSFFSSLKEGGLRLNGLALIVVVLGTGITIVLFYIFQGRITMPMLTGVLCGAITSTPALGAAEEALEQLHNSGTLIELPQISLGYAVAYPISIIGTILVCMLLKNLFRVDTYKEVQSLREPNPQEKPDILTFRIVNPQIAGKTIAQIRELFGHQFVASRINNGHEVFIPHADSTIHVGDIVRLVTRDANATKLEAFLGERIDDYQWHDSSEALVSRKIVVTQNNINGKTIRQLYLRTLYDVNITRIIRSGIPLLARPDLVLQVGDKVIVVGPAVSVAKVETILGNTLTRLNEPHLFTIFIGILLGIVIGTIPIHFPGMPVPAKLGLVAGPLLVALLLGRFGYKLKLITYTTQSANLMLREVGLCLFLASVGLSAGGDFVHSVISPDGLLWCLCGMCITMIPLFVVGIIARYIHINFFTICGLLAGAHTNAPPLAYALAQGDTDEPVVAYSTVYPLVTFLRIIIAQILILAFV